MIAESPRAYTLPKGHLSPTQVTRMLSCGACYEAEYVLQIAKAVSINLPIGGAVHKGIEWMRMQRMAQQMVKVADAAEFAITHYESETSVGADEESGVELTIDLGSSYKSLDEGKDKVNALVRFALGAIARLDDERGGVAAVELDLINYPSPYPFPFHGRIDALYGPTIHDPRGIEDLKTSKDRNKAPDTDAAIQLTLYSEFFPDIPVLADVLSKTQPPELHAWKLQVDDASRARVHKLVLDVAENISAGRFLPNPSWKCSYSHGLPEFRLEVSS